LNKEINEHKAEFSDILQPTGKEMVSMCSIAFDVSFVVRITSLNLCELNFEKRKVQQLRTGNHSKTHRNLGYCGTQFWNNQAGKCDKYNETCGDR